METSGLCAVFHNAATRQVHRERMLVVFYDLSSSFDTVLEVEISKEEVFCVGFSRAISEPMKALFKLRMP